MIRALKEGIDIASKDLERAKKQLDKLKHYLVDYEKFSYQNDAQNLLHSILAYNRVCEELTLTSRRLPRYCGFIEAEDNISNAILEAFPVRMGYTPENWLLIDTPPLLLKKDQRANARYIRVALDRAFQKFIDDIPLDSRFCYYQSVLVFDILFKEREHNTFRYDYDSVEFTQATNSIACKFLPDDSPEFIDKYPTAEASDKDGTRIIIIPQREFSEFYAIHKSGVKYDPVLSPVPVVKT